MSDTEHREPSEYLDDVEDEFIDITNRTPSDTPRIWPPPVDLRQTSKTYVMEADLPGMNTREIEVHIESDKITLSGIREEETKHSDGDYVRRERYSRHFRRTFRLPSDVDQAKIDAELESGVLTIKMPRAKNAESVSERNVKIKTK